MGLKIEDTIKKQAKESNDLHFFLVENMSNLMTGKLNKLAVESSDFYVSGLKWMNQFISYPVLKERYLVNDAAVFCAKIWNVQPNFLITYIPQPKTTAERIKLMNIPRNNCRFTWRSLSFPPSLVKDIPRTSSRLDSDDGTFTWFLRPPIGLWKLLMYPNGAEGGKGNSLSLYLTATDYVTNGPKGRTLAVYKLRVLDQLHRNHHESATCEYWFPYDPTEIKSSAGLHKFLSLEELHRASRGILVKDEIYISVEFLLVSVSESIYGDNI